MSLKRGCHGDPFRMSLGSSNGSITQVVSIMETPFSVEPDITSKHVFIASMMQKSTRSPVLRDKPDVTCPSDCPVSDKRREVVHHELDSRPWYHKLKEEFVWQDVQCCDQSQEYSRDTEGGGILSGCATRAMASIYLQGNWELLAEYGDRRCWTHLLLSNGEF